MAAVLPMTKTCTDCRRQKPLTEFYRGNAAFGRRGKCKDCYREASRGWSNASRALTNRRAKIKKAWGITLDEFDRMLAAQGHGCAICGGVNRDRSLAIDHDHATGAIRALLCNNCNLGMGQFNEDPERLMAAAAYLIQHQEVARCG